MSKISFVTGASGFVGSNLVRRLLKDNHEVHIILRKDTKNLWRLDSIKKELNIHFGDILDYAVLKKIISKHKFNYIFHLATYGAYPKYERDEDTIVKVNCLGTLNLLNAASGRVEMFVNTGSSSEYGIKNRPMKETDSENPINLYGSAKLFSTKAAKIYSDFYGTPTVTLRPFSVYGYYEDSKRLIPYVLLNAIFGREITLNNANFVRDFVFVDDVCDAYMNAIKFKYPGEVFNVGSGVESRIIDVVNIVNRIAGSVNVRWLNISSRDEPKGWVCNTEKSKTKLRFYAKTSLRAGLKLTYKWIRKNIDYYE